MVRRPQVNPKKRKFWTIYVLTTLTLFFLSFVGSALIIINANKLVFAEDYEKYQQIMSDSEKLQAEQNNVSEADKEGRYKEMYNGMLEQNKTLKAENESLSSKNQELSSKVSKLEQELKEASKPSKDEKTEENNEENTDDTTESENDKTTDE
ncbi:MAG: hypothetical protein IKZ35_04595 [Clostridia bacterium]|nr:hypothetical protein [Clostridia bacterium]